jgi:predicted rRNA methylase YqxC with S4 and FtsJ domains
MIVMDVSFISLKKVLPTVIKCLDVGGKIVALIKPNLKLKPNT